MSGINRMLKIYSFGVKNEGETPVTASLHFENTENLKISIPTSVVTKVG